MVHTRLHACMQRPPWNATTPKLEPMLMILPRPCGIMTRAAAWQAKNTLLNDASTVLSNSSSVTSRAGVVPVHPARCSRGCRGVRTSRWRRRPCGGHPPLGDVGELDDALAAQLRDFSLDLLDLVVAALGMLGEHQVRAGLREAERDGAADPLRCAGDDRNLVLQAEAGMNSRSLRG